MFAYAAIPLTCWLCVLVVTPRKPRVGNEIEELVYVRLLGRHDALRLLATVVTAMTFFVFVLTLPSRTAPAPDTLPVGQQAFTVGQQTLQAGQQNCTHPTLGVPTCYRLQMDGRWAREDQR